jgi:serine/threonine-protein kinase
LQQQGASLSTDLIGALLGPYEIVEFLGMHAVAEVYMGRRAENNRPVLIRLAGRGVPANPVWSAQFRREAKAIAGLRHANIAPAYDFGEALDGHYMVTDYPEDPTLADLLVETRAGTRTLQPEDLTFIIRQIAAALDHAHTKGVIHRDVSPPHIMITRSGQAILGDFGLALLLTRGADDQTGGASFAVPEYMAPEVLAESRAASPASDIYSLGIVLYEMLTNDLPFRPSNQVNAALHTITGATPDPRLRKADVPPAVAEVVLTALADAPKYRFKNTMQLAEGLELAYRYPNGAPRSTSQPLPARSKKSAKSAEPGLPIGRRPTAERIAVRRGPSPQNERREKARLRAELRDIQDTEKRRQREEQLQKREEQRRIMRAKSRAFWNRWGPALTVLGLFLVISGAIVIGLQAAGLLSISVAPPTLPMMFSGGTVAVTDLPLAASSTAAATLPPTWTPVLSATPFPPDASTPIPAVVFTPLEVGTTAFRVEDGVAMQFVPASQFLMGTNDPTRSPYARPQHPVMLSD